MKKGLFAVFIILFVSSCQLVDKDYTIKGAVVGEWEWQRTSGGIMGEVIEADSVDYTKKLVISENSTASVYKDGDLVETFDLIFGKPEWLDKATWILTPRGEQKVEILSYISSLKDGKLVISDSCTDCYTSFYTKKN